MKQVIPETLPEQEQARLIERPDGFYWQEKDGPREHGPFATLLDAAMDMQSTGEDTPEPGETLAEAEAEMGIADWTDPETGAPAEEMDGARFEEH